MKKTYITPASLTVKLAGRDAVLQVVSANDYLLGTGFEGNTLDNNVTNADTKELFGKSIWENEW